MIVKEEKDKKYPKVNYALIIKGQDCIMKHLNMIDSPITNDTLLVKDEVKGTYLYFIIFVIHFYITNLN